MPAEFRFAPKAHVGITHRRDLDGLDERMRAFFAAVTTARVAARARALPAPAPASRPGAPRRARSEPCPTDTAAAFELGPAWLAGDVAGDVLDRLDGRRATVALVETDSPAARPISTSGPFTYARLRRSHYGAAELDRWGERLAKLQAEGRDVYVYLRHDDDGHAPGYARPTDGEIS